MPIMNKRRDQQPVDGRSLGGNPAHERAQDLAERQEHRYTGP